MRASQRKDYVGPSSALRILLDDVSAGEKASGTITLESAIAGDVVTINGLAYTAVAGTKADDTEFSIDTSDTAAATDLADSIDDDVRSGFIDDVTATADTGVVTVVAVSIGSNGNGIPMTTDDETITLSGATLENGANASTVTVNGNIYTAVTGSKADDTKFSIDTSDTAAATDLADSIDDDIRTGTISGTVITATSDDAYVTVISSKVVNAETNTSDIKLSGSTSTLSSLASNVADNNETLKRVNFMNTPFSVQATGVDKVPGRQIIVDSEAKFNTITARTRVLFGGRQGYIKSITESTSLIFTWFDKDNDKVDTTKTMAEVIASGSMFILVEKY